MKLILKNLKQVQYLIEIESEKNTVKDLKNEIEKVHGFDSNLIKLLHNGRVLEDSKTLEEYQIKNENVIIMMNTKPRPKPNPQPVEQPKPESQKKEEAEKKEEQPKKEEDKPKPNFSEQINSLVEMGYEREKVEKALNASNGNIDLAIEFLSSGNIPEPSANNQNNQQSQSNATSSNLPLELRRNASLMKIVCRDQPEKIISILNSLKQKNPALLNKIKEHQQEFQNLLVSPITQEDIDTYKLLEDEIRGLGGAGGRRPGQVQIRLTPEEAEAVKRLKDLGDFSQSEVLQAYLACDKNEELAANYLFEQKMRDEEEAMNNNNNNNNQGQ
jgi:UV excision repair protein RAD23